MGEDIGRSSTQSSIAGLQARSGDFASALKTADIITRPDYKTQTLLAIGNAQLEAKDLAGARLTLARAWQLAEKQSSDYDLRRIAEAQVEAGDLAGAQRAVTLIKSDLAKGSEKSELQFAIAKAQTKNGDIAGALKTAEFIQHVGLKSLAQRAVVEKQAETGDVAAALKTAALIYDAKYKASAQKAVADAQIKAGISQAPRAPPTRSGMPATRMSCG